MARAKPVDKTVDIYSGKETSRDDAEKSLKSSVMWEQIKRQFSIVEQRIFVEHWKGLVGQFRGDIVATEYLQIAEMIKLELLANRCLEAQQSCKSSINNLENIIQTQMDKPEDQRDSRLLGGAEADIIQNRTAILAMNKDYLAIVDKKENMLKSLKGTREQRVKAIENSKSNMIDWFKILISDESVRKSIGIEAAKMRLAIEKERERLSGLHQFLDGEIDRCILDSDSVTPEDSK